MRRLEIERKQASHESMKQEEEEEAHQSPPSSYLNWFVGAEETDNHEDWTQKVSTCRFFNMGYGLKWAIRKMILKTFGTLRFDTSTIDSCRSSCRLHKCSIKV